MPAPTPAEESFDLYNALLRTAPGDKEAVQRILWQSRKLERQLPNDFRIRVVLVTALAMAEEPSEALSAIERIGELWVGQERDSIVSFLEVLLSLWDLERAKLVASDLLQNPLHDDIVAKTRIAECAIALGDYDWLTNLSTLDEAIPGFQRAKDALEVIAESKLHEHFQKQQQLVRKHVAGTACFTSHSVLGLEDDAPMIATHIFAAADRKECRRIENDISESLADYYESQGLPPGVYIPYFTTIISPLATAAPALAAA